MATETPKPDDVLRRMLAMKPQPKVSPTKAKPKPSASSASASDNGR